MIIRTTIFIAVLILLFSTICISDPCRFEYPGKGVIDFSFIGRTDEKATYSDETTRTASNFKYSYNPCRSFSQGTSCIGVSVCQISKDEKYTFTLGTQESASWNPGSDLDGVPSVNYAYADKNVTVLLQCSAEGNNEFQAFGEDPKNNYKFQLTHKCACWNGCSNTSSTTTTTATTMTTTHTSSVTTTTTALSCSTCMVTYYNSGASGATTTTSCSSACALTNNYPSRSPGIGVAFVGHNSTCLDVVSTSPGSTYCSYFCGPCHGTGSGTYFSINNTAFYYSIYSYGASDGTSPPSGYNYGVDVGVYYGRLASCDGSDSYYCCCA